MSATYPYPYSSTALMSLMGSIQATVYAICIEKDWSAWKLGWNIRLLTTIYAVNLFIYICIIYHRTKSMNTVISSI